MTFFGPDIRNGLPIGLGSVAGFGRRAFTPSVLFAAGEQGFWYDPTDIPVNWRRNLLTYTEQFDNAAWSQSRVTVTANATTAPDGTLTADKMVATAVAGTHREFQFVSKAATPLAYTFSCYIKAAEYGFAMVRLADSTETDSASCTVNLATGEILTGASGFTGQSGAAVSVGNGWWRVSVSATTDAETTVNGMVFIQTSLAVLGSSFTGNGSDGIFVWGAQLERGSVATDYQRIVTPEISFLDYQPQPVMYTDSAGTTPVTAVEQAVGLILDKSKGLVFSGNLVSNPGPFANTTGWTGQNGATLSVASAKLRVSGNGATAFPFASTPFTTVVGRGYFVSTDVAFVSGVNDSVYIQKSDAAASVVNGVTSGTAPATSKTLFFVATATTTYLQLVSDDATDVYDWDNISVRELAGNHAIQPGATNRPILRSRYNLLTYSEQFDNAAWTKRGTAAVTPNDAIAPDGTLTADKIEGLNTAGNDMFNADYTTVVIAPAGASYAPSIWVKRISTSGVFFVGNPTNSAQGQWNVDLSQLPDAWTRITATTTGVTVVNPFVTSASGTGGIQLRAVSGGPLSMHIWGADLRRSNDTYLPYQRIAAATDYDTVGFPPYLAFDGSDDSLYTGGNVDFSATDKMTLWAGVTKLSDAAAAPIIELGPDSGANNGVFAIFAPSGGGVADYYWRSKGTVASNNSVTGNASPSTRVLTAIGDIAADFANLRVDGVDNTKSDDQGTGNFASAVVNIGRRNNASAPFNGRLYQLIGRGAATSAALLSQAERWVASKQGRAL